MELNKIGIILGMAICHTLLLVVAFNIGQELDSHLLILIGVTIINLFIWGFLGYNLNKYKLELKEDKS